MSNLRKKISDFVLGIKIQENIKTNDKEVDVISYHKKAVYLERMLQSVYSNSGKSVFNIIYKSVSIILAIVIIGSLLFVVFSLPDFGNPFNPANNIVSGRYIEKGVEESGAMNLVSNLILDYRAFDTLGEAHVLLVASSAVIILLLNIKKDNNNNYEKSLIDEYVSDTILRKGANLIVPIILLFGIYIILNGHLSPGGGFSGGTILGSGLILHNLAFGRYSISKIININTYKIGIILAAGFYAIGKSYSFFTGANQIHSVISNGVPGNIFSAGLILPINISVGIIVSLTMFGFYSLFDRGGI